VPDDQHPVNDSPHIDPGLKEFIERVIIPILVKEYLAQSQEPEVLGPKFRGTDGQPTCAAASCLDRILYRHGATPSSSVTTNDFGAHLIVLGTRTSIHFLS
jgi:hypothetical protein